MGRKDGHNKATIKNKFAPGALVQRADGSRLWFSVKQKHWNNRTMRKNSRALAILQEQQLTWDMCIHLMTGREATSGKAASTKLFAKLVPCTIPCWRIHFTRARKMSGIDTQSLDRSACSWCGHVLGEVDACFEKV